VCVSEILASSSNNIYLNLITKEDKHFTVELTSQGFRVRCHKNFCSEKKIYQYLNLTAKLWGPTQAEKNS
jgi:hypothetical protein